MLCIKKLRVYIAISTPAVIGEYKNYNACVITSLTKVEKAWDI